jgi:hypothetical protein
MVAEHLKPSISSRRNRAPPKKKGGPGRGKKRVTFTNPDGSTYTKIVPNATKIVPQPGQTIKHVAKGEKALADVATLQPTKDPQQPPGDGGEGEGEAEAEGEEGSGDDDDEGDDEDDDREDGELSDDDAPRAATTPAKPDASSGNSQPMEDVQPTCQPAPTQAEASAPLPQPPTAEPAPKPESEPEPQPNPKPKPKPAEIAADADDTARECSPARTAESSPEMPLAQSHSRNASLAEPAPLSLDTATEARNAPEVAVADADEGGDDNKEGEAAPKQADVQEQEKETTNTTVAAAAAAADADTEMPSDTFDDGDEDLLGNLEKSLA